MHHLRTLLSVLVVSTIVAAVVINDAQQRADAIEHDALVVEPVFNSQSYVESTAPALSASGTSRLYMDSTTHTIQASTNGGAYTSMTVGSGVANQVTYYSGVGVLAGDTGYTYDASTDTATLVGSIIVGAGSAGTPSVRSAADGDSGIAFAAGEVDIVADAVTRLFVNSGSASTVAGINMIALGGDAAATPNFQVEAGEGMYDCGTNCIALAANAIDVLNANVTNTILAQDDTKETIGDTGSNGSFTWTLDAVTRLAMATSGQLTLTSSATTIDTACTCTSESVASGSNDTEGEITSTCTASQTTLVNFGTTWGAAPTCLCAAINAAGGTTVVSCSASTTVLTLTAVGISTAGQWGYHCFRKS